MAGSTIISVARLLRELPPGASNDNNQVTDAVDQATDFCNTWAIKYDPWDEYDTSPDTPRAPNSIVRICLEVGKAYYHMAIGEIWRNREEQTTWEQVLAFYETRLKTIKVAPTWEEQTISLGSDNAMVIGSRTNTGGMWPRVIPQTAQVISGTTVYLQPDDWHISKGGEFDNEYRDAWYLYAESSSLSGTLRYMRTYRSDGYDYATYQAA